ncbi:MAG TPA: hypothetical protein VE966_03870, partial [Gemmatimonadales bacterium]|nr:hypothetical protein [Gemmatimonadales bacterium]
MVFDMGPPWLPYGGRLHANPTPGGKGGKWLLRLTFDRQLMGITSPGLSSTRDIRLFISFREPMPDVQRIDLLDPAEVAR